MEIRYTKADPTGNITALVENSAPCRSACEAVFASDESIEQLGFLGESVNADIALDMAGGEFCGNACLCAAAYHLRRAELDSGSVKVAISGADKPVEVEMRALGCGEFVGSLDMPLPQSLGSAETPVGTAPIVHFPGISHIILPASVSSGEAEKLIRPLCASLGVEALGLMLYDGERAHLHPLVYVPGADTLCWERSCASGTSAVGAWLATHTGQDICLSISQPGGTLGIAADISEGRLCRLRLSGRVRLGSSECINI